VNRSLRLDPIACDGRGLCAEILPELIRLDDWGYPIIEPGPVPHELEGHAERAVGACPLLALSLERGDKDAASRPRRRAAGVSR
jgi:ferredoxin